MSGYDPIQAIEQLQEYVNTKVDHGQENLFRTAIFETLDILKDHIRDSVEMSSLERLEQLRKDSLEKISLGKAPIPMNHTSAKVILQLVPNVSTDQRGALKVQDANKFVPLLPLIAPSGYNSGHHYDGLFTFNEYSDSNEGMGYTLLKDTAEIEAVDTYLLRDKEKRMNMTLLEKRVIQSVKSYLNVFSALGVGCPVSILLSLTGIQEYQIVNVHYGVGVPINMETMKLPVCVIQDENQDVAQTLRPMFDKIWNAGGLEGSPNYNQNGEYVGKL